MSCTIKTFIIRKNGTIEGLWDDMLARLSIRDIHVSRASQIEFNHEHGGWEIVFLPPFNDLNAKISGMYFSTRADALQYEASLLINHFLSQSQKGWHT